jgi:hypothetical protein
MNDDRNWVDQPKELIGAPILANLSKAVWREGQKDEFQIEVRRAPGSGYYLTFGTLFNDQTILAEDGDAAFMAIQSAEKSNKIPVGCTLLKNAEGLDKMEKNYG